MMMVSKDALSKFMIVYRLLQVLPCLVTFFFFSGGHAIHFHDFWIVGGSVNMFHLLYLL